jgi:hypothetical protein
MQGQGKQRFCCSEGAVLMIMTRHGACIQQLSVQVGMFAAGQ